jgi:hypothetical protein
MSDSAPHTGPTSHTRSLQPNQLCALVHYLVDAQIGLFSMKLHLTELCCRMYIFRSCWKETQSIQKMYICEFVQHSSLTNLTRRLQGKAAEEAGQAVVKEAQAVSSGAHGRYLYQGPHISAQRASHQGRQVLSKLEFPSPR